MKKSTAITTGLCVIVVGGLVALATPAVATVSAQVSTWALLQPTAEPTVTPVTAQASAPTSDGRDALGDGYLDLGNGTLIPRNDPVGCDAPAWIDEGRMSMRVIGNLVDRGVREFAAGTVGLDDQGSVMTYTVAPGDALFAIGDRFCIANALAVATLNHTRTIQPGEVLLLHPDETIPWVPYFQPDDAPAGYQQIPYQRAVEAMSVAAHAGDLDAMRTIFHNDLARLFPIAADADVIARALDAGDLGALRQMFA